MLGRRASYALQWLFERPVDETYRAMMKDSACATPMWICPDIDPGRKNILVCIDGSESGYRAVDHVGYVLSGDDRHEITIFTVQNSVNVKNVKVFDRAVAILLDHKIPAKRINCSTAWGSSASSTILEEARKGKFAAIAVGMGKKKQRGTSGITIGTTTAKLLHKVERASLWCCP
jgi:hypothetical protein